MRNGTVRVKYVQVFDNGQTDYVHTYPPPPLRKHAESQQNDGNTGSCAWTRPCLRATRGTKRTYVTGNLPIPHPKHNCRNRALQHNVQANFSEFWRYTTLCVPLSYLLFCIQL